MFMPSAIAGNGFVIGDSIRSAWKVFKKEWIVVYAVQLLPIAIAMIYDTIFVNGSQRSSLSALWMLVYIIIQLIASMGVLKAYIDLMRGKKVNMETFTSMTPKVLNYVVAQLLMLLIIFGGFLLFILPGIIFSLMFMFTPYLVIDKGMGPFEALKASAKITDNIKWDLAGFVAALFLLSYSGVFALLVGLIITIPLGALAYVSLYDKLQHRL